jgi:hypothetical protein
MNKERSGTFSLTLVVAAQRRIDKVLAAFE